MQKILKAMHSFLKIWIFCELSEVCMYGFQNFLEPKYAYLLIQFSMKFKCTFITYNMKQVYVFFVALILSINHSTGA